MALLLSIPAVQGGAALLYFGNKVVLGRELSDRPDAAHRARQLRQQMHRTVCQQKSGTRAMVGARCLE